MRIELSESAPSNPEQILGGMKTWETVDLGGVMEDFY